MKIHLSQPYSFCQQGKRTNQEDARFPDSDAPRYNGPAFVVCDGVGGQKYGEIASRTVAEVIGKSLSRLDQSRYFDNSSFKKALDEALDELDKVSGKQASEMATTVATVFFHAGGAFVAHIGDSRIYHIRPGVGILYQSDDHSLVNALVHSGNITPQEAIGHPQSNIITRCIGPRKNGYEAVASTIEIKDVEAGDYFLLCTDGVLRCVDDMKIESIVASTDDDSDKIRQLAELCRNSSDNNTAYLIGISSVGGNTPVQSAENFVDGSGGTTDPLKIFSDEIIETKTTDKKTFGDFISNLFNKIF